MNKNNQANPKAVSQPKELKQNNEFSGEFNSTTEQSAFDDYFIKELKKYLVDSNHNAV